HPFWSESGCILNPWPGSPHRLFGGIEVSADSQTASGNGEAPPWHCTPATAIFCTSVVACPLRMLAMMNLTFLTVTVALAALQSTSGAHEVLKCGLTAGSGL